MGETKRFRVTLERYLPQHVEVTVYADDMNAAEDAAMLLYKEAEEGILKWTSEVKSLKDDDFFPWVLDVAEDENKREVVSRTGGLLKDTR